MSPADKQYAVDVADDPRLPEIVASLPLSLRSTHGDEPQGVASISGTQGWADRLQRALDADVKAAVVMGPATQEAPLLSPPAAEARTVIAWPFASNPGLPLAAAAIGKNRERAVLAEIELLAPSRAALDGLILDAVVTASRLFGPMTNLDSVHRDRDGWWLVGSLFDSAVRVPVTIAVIVTDSLPAALRARMLTVDGEVTAALPVPVTAVPAKVRVVDAQGERLLPTIWETSHRASWRRAVAVAEAQEDSSDLAELRLIRGLLPGAGGAV